MACFSQLEASIVASVQSITLALVKADNETLLPVSWDLAITYNCSSKIGDHGGTLSPAALIISTTMPDGPAALPPTSSLRWPSVIHHVNSGWERRAF